MDRIIYERDFDGELKQEGVGVREARKIEFEVSPDLNVSEFKLICIRMAKSLGYSDSNIKEVFG